MKPWLILAAGAVGGILLMWFFTPRPEPDTQVLDALRDSVAVTRAQVQRDSVSLAAKDDTLRVAFEHAETVAQTSRLVTSAARQRATVAEGETRAVLDSLGASTASLDSLVAAHADEVAAMRAEATARDAERAILYRRVEAGDVESASLREQVRRMEAASAEEEAIRAALRGQLRGAKIRERVAEGAAVGVLVWKVLG